MMLAMTTSLNFDTSLISNLNVLCVFKKLVQQMSCVFYTCGVNELLSMNCVSIHILPPNHDHHHINHFGLYIFLKQCHHAFQLVILVLGE